MYEVGGVYSGAPRRVSTLDWCLGEWKKGMRILAVEVEGEVPVRLPDGQFTVSRLKIVGEVEEDLIQKNRAPR